MENNPKKKRHSIELIGDVAEEFLQAKKEFGYRKSTKFVEAFVKQTSLIRNYFRWFMQQKSKIGNNLNQIARHLNSGEIVDDEILKMVKEIHEMEDEMLRILKKNADKQF
jgi:hypothetical protein